MNDVDESVPNVEAILDVICNCQTQLYYIALNDSRQLDSFVSMQ